MSDRDLDVRRRALVAARELARQGVARLRRASVWSGEAVADHLRDGDRLAERAAETEVTAATTPPRTYGTIDAPHHLPARRAEPDRSLLRARSARSTKSSRQIDDVIGMIMIVSTTIAVKTVDSTCCGRRRRSGSSRSSCSGTARRAARRTAPSTKMPQSPITTLGTAASISISVPTGPRIDGGASSLRKSPIAIESGAASSTRPERGDDRPDDERRAPRTGSVTGFQALSQTKLRPKSLIAGHAPSKTFQMIAAIDRARASSAASGGDARAAQRRRSGRRGGACAERGDGAGTRSGFHRAPAFQLARRGARARSPPRHTSFTSCAPRGAGARRHSDA